MIFASHLMKSVCGCSMLLRTYCSSTLFVTGNKAHKTASILIPHLDCEERFQGLENLKRNVMLRKLDLDVNNVHQLWEKLRSVEQTKECMEQKRVEIASITKALKKNNNFQEIEKLKVQGRSLRDDIKKVTKKFWEMQEKAIGQFLSLPNDLDPDTPEMEEKVLYEFGNVPQDPSVCHTVIGNKQDLVRYFSPVCYYLTGAAAVYELKLLQHFADSLHEAEFAETCNSDFVRSIVVEGCGMKHINSVSVFTIEHSDTGVSDINNRLHLVGGASLPAYCACHAKTIVTGSLPVRYFTIGRQYSPIQSKSLPGLFHTCQASCVEVFVLTSDTLKELKAEFQRTLKAVTGIYRSLGLPFRIVLFPANSLKQWESLRASIQMFSVHNKSFIEVGYLSLCNNYISKRLLMYYETPEKDKKFVQVLSGTVLSVPKFLGCVLENGHFSDLNI
ncbi:serine--tRNA synthetase-like protein Slimp [Schistocerca cancellata]|uniref:serine--tRNA synthetase-like protein Slimp n=1 Tax=Schistocerca cancellata TaxID=274614 RepID=UPI00211767E5|nr:serine--tRNA synthetase-like protein Slimp [Schistocerca cancellata]